jgi:hypothetical protein
MKMVLKGWVNKKNTALKAKPKIKMDYFKPT